MVVGFPLGIKDSFKNKVSIDLITTLMIFWVY